MNTLRTILIFAVLGAVGYGVYATLNRKPIPAPPEAIPEDWDKGPQVSINNDGPSGPDLLGGSPMSNVGPGSAAPPATVPTGDEAPPFAPPPGNTDAALAPPYTPSPVGAMPDQGAPLADAPLAQAPPAEFANNGAGYANPPLPGGPAAPGYENQQMVPGVAVDPAAPAQPLDNSAYGTAPAAGFDPATGAPIGAAVPPGMESAPQHPGAPTGFEVQNPAAGDASYAPGAGQGVAPDEFANAWPSIQQALQQDRLVEAHRELSRWITDPRLTDAERHQVHDLCDHLAGTLIYSRESLLEPPYEVQPGDTLEHVATQYQVPYKLLAKINGIQPPYTLSQGEKLKVLRGPFSADVDLTHFALTLWLGDQYAGRFPIGIGSDSTTPEGSFDVQEKLENPTYYGRDGTIAADDPSNPLGERWISLGNQIGIHGTIDPNSIGKAESRGCIRMTERDIDDVFDILGPGSKVTIRR